MSVRLIGSDLVGALLGVDQFGNYRVRWSDGDVVYLIEPARVEIV